MGKTDRDCCGAYDAIGRWMCTRLSGHDGDHIACCIDLRGRVEEVCARWPQKSPALTVPRCDHAERLHALEHELGRIAHALGVAPDADLVEAAHAVMARLANADAERGALLDEAEERQDDLEAARQRAGLAEQQLRLVGFALQSAGVGGTSAVGQAKEAAQEIGRLRVALDRAVRANEAILRAAEEERR